VDRFPRELAEHTRATLLFDLATIAANMDRIATAASANGIRVLFAAKSFPDPRVVALAAERLDGFDVASPAELAAASGRIISICDPTGRTRARDGGRTIVSVETSAQLAAVPSHAEIAVRISASIAGRDPAIGSILDGTGHRRSRFGLESRAEIATLVAGRRVGVHLHHGPVTATSPERFIGSARAALDLLDFEPTFINLGGAWHGIADFTDAFAKIRAAIPASIEVLVEPGRAFAANAGFACGIVMASRTLEDRELRVVDLSRACHLRWSPVALVAPPARNGFARKVSIVGPTCYEDDTIGDWLVEPQHVDERVILRDVPGYALAWNTGFAGIPPADVVIR
jgi:diaminopimelate decarboxylase